MYRVSVNKYSHEGSGATRIHSEYSTLAEAEAMASTLRASGHYRFVVVAEVVR